MPTSPPINPHESHKLPRSFFTIGRKLLLGFGFPASLIILITIINYFASVDATRAINRTNDLHVPTAASAATARYHLISMLSDMRAYLALGNEEYREGYHMHLAALQEHIAALNNHLHANEAFEGVDGQDARLAELSHALDTWIPLGEELFALHNDQLAREPALRILAIEVNPSISETLTYIDQMLRDQQQREPTPAHAILLADIAGMQSSFIQMVAAIRGYVTSGRENFKVEYGTTLMNNERLVSLVVAKRDQLLPTQQAALDAMVLSRQTFLDLADDMLLISEGEHAREDLFLFRNEAVPLANTMSQILSDIAQEQQGYVEQDLAAGRAGLAQAHIYSLAAGVIAVVLSIGMALLLNRQVAGPVRRLTRVAERVSQGDLGSRAVVESGDEIGILAHTFNTMTNHLKESDQRLREANAQLSSANEQLESIAQEQRATIQIQEATLLELSTPLIPISERVAVMPLIGHLDAQRAEQMLKTLLTAIHRQRLRVIILDMTGLVIVDTHVASILIRTMQAVRLVGAQVIVTGVRREIAQTVIAQGIDLSNMRIYSTLERGIASAMEYTA